MYQNYTPAIEEAETTAELDAVVNRMLVKNDLSDIRLLNPEATYADLAQHLEEDGELFYGSEFLQDLNNVIYWLQSAAKKLLSMENN